MLSIPSLSTNAHGAASLPFLEYLRHAIRNAFVELGCEILVYAFDGAKQSRRYNSFFSL
jgi:hypothetical protein